MKGRRVVVTSIGIVTALGIGVKETTVALKNGSSGIRNISVFKIKEGVKSQVGAEIPEDILEKEVPKKFRHLLSRTDKLAILAIDQILSKLSSNLRNKTGICLGGTTGGMRDSEIYLQKTLKGEPASKYRLKFHPVYSTTEKITHLYGLKGPRLTISTACSSSANAIAIASYLISNGTVDIMIAGGVDSLCELTFYGFNILGAMDEGPCKPFSKYRNGLTLGEGSGFLLLERYESAMERGVNPLAEVYGWGISSDAYHITQPDPESKGAIKAMKEALQLSKLKAEDITYINAHGTGTKANDIMEAKAIKAVFPKNYKQIYVSSTKGATGHTLGAAGSIESAISIMSLIGNFIPPNVNVKKEELDPEIDLNIVTPDKLQEINIKDKGIKAVLNNSFGFGGSNCSLIFGRVGIKATDTNNEEVEAKPNKRIFIWNNSTINTKELVKEELHKKEIASIIRKADNLSKATIDSCINTLALFKEGVDSEKTGIFGVTSWGALDLSFSFLLRLYEKGPKFLRALDFPNTVLNAPSSYVTILAKATGINLTFTHAEIGPLWSIIFGYEYIRQGLLNNVIVVSYEEHSKLIPEIMGQCTPGDDFIRVESNRSFVISSNTEQFKIEPIYEILYWTWGVTKEELEKKICLNGIKLEEIKFIVTTTSFTEWNESIALENLFKINPQKGELLLLLAPGEAIKENFSYKKRGGYLGIVLKRM